MSRWKAAGLHLLISLVVAILAGSLIYFVWYPPPYFQVAGGSTLMLVMMGVDVDHRTIPYPGHIQVRQERLAV